MKKKRKCSTFLFFIAAFAIIVSLVAIKPLKGKSDTPNALLGEIRDGDGDSGFVLFGINPLPTIRKITGR